MTTNEFKELFNKGFNKTKIDYENVENGDSELTCFYCGEQAGLKDEKIICKNGHEDNLLKYTGKYIEMEHDLLTCLINQNCETKIQSDYE